MNTSEDDDLIVSDVVDDVERETFQAGLPQLSAGDLVLKGVFLDKQEDGFNGLDEPNRLKLLDLIHSVKAEGVAVVVSTHDIVLAQETCEKVLLLANRQIGFGPKEEILVPELIAEAYGGHVPEEYHAFADSAKPKKTSAEAVSNG